MMWQHMVRYSKYKLEFDSIDTEERWDRNIKIYENYTNRLSLHACNVAQYGKVSMCLCM